MRELQYALDNDARFIVMVPGPVMTPSGGRSPADPIFDPFWQLANDSGITVLYHGGDSRYSNYLVDWGEGGHTESFRANAFRGIASPNPTQDTLANLLAHGLFHRFPNLRIAFIETGSDWVFHLYDKLKKSYGQVPHMYPEDPRETFKRHVWVSPFYEDDLGGAARIWSASDRMLMGSDYPHAEGLEDPASYIKDLKNFDFTDEECKKVMPDNGWALTKRQPA